MPGTDWNERYKNGNLPWDTGEPDEHLVKLVNSSGLNPGKALEVGCGTGTNSIWLARQGYSVLGVEVAELAINLAKQKLKDDSLSCDFVLMDFLRDNSLNASFDLVFDRGCFHSFDEESERLLFARKVSQVLKMDGIWISLVGSTEGGPRESGPPRRSAIDVTTAIEPYLEILEMRAVYFQTNLPFSAKAWLCISRQRENPAEPSTKR